MQLILCDIIRAHKSDVIFLSKTLVHDQRIGEIKVKLNFDYCFSVDCFGRSDGLALFWRKPFDCRCGNLPFGGRVTRDSRVRLPRKENARSRHQCLFEENVRKTKKGVYEF